MAQQLRPSITRVQGIAMAVGSVLGPGILVLPAITAEKAGPASFISWMVMCALTLPLALTLGRLATKWPNAGGIIAYVRMSFGPLAGRLTGWLFLGGMPLVIPIDALIGANYLGSIFHLSHIGITLIAAAILLISVILNIRGVEISAWVQVLIVCVIMALLLFAVLMASPHMQSHAFWPFAPHGISPVAMAAMMIFWCFAGWEMVVHLAEEFKNPAKDMQVSLSWGAIVISLLYLAIVFVTIGTHAYGGNGGLAPISMLVQKSAGEIGRDFIALLAPLIIFGALHVCIAGFSRMLYAQAREGDFPKGFAKVHANYQTPVTALIGLGIIFGMILAFNVLVNPDLDAFIQWASVVFLALYMVAMAAALNLLPRKSMGWWMAVFPLIVCMILYPFSGWAGVYPPALILLGFLYSFLWKKKRKPFVSSRSINK